MCNNLSKSCQMVTLATASWNRPAPLIRRVSSRAPPVPFVPPPFSLACASVTSDAASREAIANDDDEQMSSEAHNSPLHSNSSHRAA